MVTVTNKHVMSWDLMHYAVMTGLPCFVQIYEGYAVEIQQH